MTNASGYIDLLEEMVAIPAISRSENKRADFLESFMKSKGWTTNRFGNNLIIQGLSENLPGDTRASRASRASGTSGISGMDSINSLPDSKWLLLNSHIDTVSPSAGWKGDPFQPVRRNGRITALGSNDAGASVVSLLAVFDYFTANHPGHPLLLLLSAEEEVSGSGGLESVLTGLDQVEFAIVGEPTGMQPAVAERGLMVIDAVAEGESAHVAHAEGVNAIHRAMEDISSLRQISFEKDSQWLSPPSLHVTMIEAGTQHNVIPDRCKYVIDVRSNDIYSNEILLEKISNTCSSTIVPRSTRLSSSALPASHFAFNAMHAMDMQPYGSPTLSDMALMPFHAIKLGPGDSKRSHKAGEYIRIREIEEAIPRYIEFIERLLIQKS